MLLQDDQTLEDGQKIANDLQQKLGVQEEDLLSEAYMDMILKKWNVWYSVVDFQY